MIAVSGTVNIYFHVTHCSPHFLLNIDRGNSRPRPHFRVRLQSISEVAIRVFPGWHREDKHWNIDEMQQSSSLPIDLSEFRESEPIGICKNINSIHDQGRGYLYLEDRRSKRGFPPTLRKTTWIFNFYCNAVFLKAIHLHLVWRFQNGITLEYWTSGSGRNKLLSSSKPRPTSLKRTSWYLTPKCYTFLKSAGPGQ